MTQSTCSIDGCSSPTDSRGWCAMHYTRWRRHGDPQFTRRPGRRTDSHGYVSLWKPGHPLARRDGYVFEHRYVVFEAGIAVPEGHHVHHVNGNKSDNRLSNLEVVSESEHHKHHVAATRFITNQFGTYPLHRDTPPTCHACGSTDVAVYPAGNRSCRPCRNRRERAKRAARAA